MKTTITIPYPDDWHCHLRDHEYLERTVLDHSRSFRRAIVMPNLVPPITTVSAAEQYRARIMQIVGSDNFKPLMTFYITSDLSIDEVLTGKRLGILHACKFYPLNATTNSSAGVHKMSDCDALFAVMEQEDIPLLIHGELIASQVDTIDAEKQFIDKELISLIRRFPKLRIVLEHISTKHAVDFIMEASSCVAATITPHHLLLTMNDLLGDGLRPHNYCKPILKLLADREALTAAAISGNEKFFLGTDSAPHAQCFKESELVCAGVYNSCTAMAIYVEVFASYAALDKFAIFASYAGAKFYNLPINKDMMILVNEPWVVPSSLTFGKYMVTPFLAGKELQWKIKY